MSNSSPISLSTVCESLRKTVENFSNANSSHLEELDSHAYILNQRKKIEQSDGAELATSFDLADSGQPNEISDREKDVKNISTDISISTVAAMHRLATTLKKKERRSAQVGKRHQHINSIYTTNELSQTLSLLSQDSRIVDEQIELSGMTEEEVELNHQHFKNLLEDVHVTNAERINKLTKSLHALKKKQQDIFLNALEKYKHTTNFHRINGRVNELVNQINKIKSSLSEKRYAVQLKKAESNVSAEELRLKFETETEIYIRNLLQSIQENTGALDLLTQRHEAIKQETDVLCTQLGKLLHDLEKEEKSKLTNLLKQKGNNRGKTFDDDALQIHDVFPFMASEGEYTEAMIKEANSIVEVILKKLESNRSVAEELEENLNLQKLDLNKLLRSEENKSLERLKLMILTSQKRCERKTVRANMLSMLLEKIDGNIPPPRSEHPSSSTSLHKNAISAATNPTLPISSSQGRRTASSNEPNESSSKSSVDDTNANKRKVITPETIEDNYTSLKPTENAFEILQKRLQAAVSDKITSDEDKSSTIDNSNDRQIGRIVAPHQESRTMQAISLGENYVSGKYRTSVLIPNSQAPVQTRRVSALQKSLVGGCTVAPNYTLSNNKDYVPETKGNKKTISQIPNASTNNEFKGLRDSATEEEKAFFAKSFGFQIAAEQLKSLCDLLCEWDKEAVDKDGMLPLPERRSPNKLPRELIKEIIANNSLSSEEKELETVEIIRSKTALLLPQMKLAFRQQKIILNRIKELSKSLKKEVNYCETIRKDILNKSEGKEWSENTEPGKFQSQTALRKQLIVKIKSELQDLEQRITEKKRVVERMRRLGDQVAN